MPSPSFTIASLTETITILMNTPMIPPLEDEMQGVELALTDLPPQSSRRQQVSLSVNQSSDIIVQGVVKLIRLESISESIYRQHKVIPNDNLIRRCIVTKQR